MAKLKSINSNEKYTGKAQPNTVSEFTKKSHPFIKYKTKDLTCIIIEIAIHLEDVIRQISSYLELLTKVKGGNPNTMSAAKA